MQSDATPIFAPPKPLIPEILRALLSSNLSLSEVADTYHTTPSALAAWMQSPAILDQLRSLDSLEAFRTQLVARTLLPKALAACSTIITDFNRTPRDAAAAPTPNSASPSDPLRAAIVRIRTFESVRKAATLILQLSRPGWHASPTRVSGASPEGLGWEPPIHTKRPRTTSPPIPRSGTEIPPDLAPAAPHLTTPPPAAQPTQPNPPTTDPPLPLDFPPLPPLTPISSLRPRSSRTSASLLSVAGTPTSDHWP